MSINPSQNEDLDLIDILLSSMDPGNILNIRLFIYFLINKNSK
jgi:hypothetical protein